MAGVARAAGLAGTPAGGIEPREMIAPAPAPMTPDARPLVERSALSGAARGVERDAVAVAVAAAADRLARPSRALPCRDDDRHVALPQAVLRLPMGFARQSRRRSAGDTDGADLRPATGGEADRDGDPGADRRRADPGRARGAWRPGAADDRLRAAAGLWFSVPVRLPQLHAVDGVRAAGVRAVAAARAGGALSAAGGAVPGRSRR